MVTFLGPTIFEGAKQGIHIYDDEIFGPVVCLRKAESLGEVIKWIMIVHSETR